MGRYWGVRPARVQFRGVGLRYSGRCGRLVRTLVVALTRGMAARTAAAERPAAGAPILPVPQPSQIGVQVVPRLGQTSGQRFGFGLDRCRQGSLVQDLARRDGGVLGLAFAGSTRLGCGAIPRDGPGRPPRHCGLHQPLPDAAALPRSGLGRRRRPPSDALADFGRFVRTQQQLGCGGLLPCGRLLSRGRRRSRRGWPRRRRGRAVRRSIGRFRPRFRVHRPQQPGDLDGRIFRPHGVVRVAIRRRHG